MCVRVCVSVCVCVREYVCISMEPCAAPVVVAEHAAPHVGHARHAVVLVRSVPDGARHLELPHHPTLPVGR